MPRRRLIALAAVVAGSLCLASPAAAVMLAPIGTYSAPVFVTSDPSDPEQLFVVEREGRIRLTAAGQTGTFVDLSSLVLSEGEPGGGPEHGLLSMAFSPDYATSGRFYVYYTGIDAAAYVGELVASGSSADPSTLNTVIRIEHPPTDHYGGQLQSGRDGRLYISTGDGLAPGDPGENAQDLGSLLGKILRISPTPGGGYTIPPGNPFAGNTAGMDEIWSYGLRNPWRFSFDRETGDLLIGDVGEDNWEEVDFAPASDCHAGRYDCAEAGKGENFGWDCYEGRHDFELAGCPELASTTQPVLEYGHNGLASVTGGYVVRDPGLTQLQGRYVYADFPTGAIRSFVPALPDAVDDRSENLAVPYLSSLGEDACGRVYVASLSGPVYRLVDKTPTECLRPRAGQNAPETTITKGPPAKSRIKSPVFEFISSEPGSSFECRIDASPYEPCSSPRAENVSRAKHVFEARATDAAGNTDPTPAAYGFKVKKRRKGKK